MKNEEAFYKIKHNRSISDSYRRIWEDKLEDRTDKMEDVRETEERESASNDSKVPISLKQEIQQLEKKLHDQFAVRRALENALGQKSCDNSPSNDDNSNNSLPNPTKELIEEITILELQVTYLERHILSLYRNLTPSISLQTGDLQLNQPKRPFKQETPNSFPSISFKTGDLQLSQKRTFEEEISNLIISSSSNQTGDLQLSSRRSETRVSDMRPHQRQHGIGHTGPLSGVSSMRPHQRQHGIGHTGPLSGVSSMRPHERLHGIGRSHSTLLSRSSRVSPSEKSMSRVLKSSFTSPLNFVQEKQDKKEYSSNIISLAEHLGTKVSDHITLTPNKLSEELIRCMCTIYHKMKLSQNSGAKMKFSSSSYSPCSSFSSLSMFSSQNLIADIWSPRSKRQNCSEIAGLDCIISENIRDFSGPYKLFPCNSFFEVSCLESSVNVEIEDLLGNYKLLIQRLETVDPTGLKNDEKVAFWINIHNSLIMHAHMEKGIPRNNKRRLESLNKVGYLIKGQRVNMEMIQGQILGCSKTPSSQWLKLLLYKKVKSRTGADWQRSPVDHSMPLLHFALCSGTRSDPIVRIYNPKRLYNQLETAKEEYIRSTINIKKENKILLPRLIESYVKDAGLNMQQTLQMVERYLPQSLRVLLQNRHQGNSRKILEWIPHDFTFRYLISREAANFQTI